MVGWFEYVLDRFLFGAWDSAYFSGGVYLLAVSFRVSGIILVTKKSFGVQKTWVIFADWIDPMVGIRGPKNSAQKPQPL